MSVLALRLAGPLQSWGVESRFVRRTTESAPTKSGILGLLAAAQGRRRSDPIEDLLQLRLAVRTDQPGRMLRDFHTAHHRLTGLSMPLSQRFYMTDAVYVAVIDGPQQLVDGLADALGDPAFPIYLGRRSCVPEGRVSLGVDHEKSAEEVIRTLPWQVGPRTRRANRREPRVRVAVQADVGVFDGMTADRQLRDQPISFSPERREYDLREVVDLTICLDNPDYEGEKVASESGTHDPFEAVRAQA